MQRYTNNIQTQTGQAIAGALVTVLNFPSLSTATIYSDNNSTPLANPVVTDSKGFFAFYAVNGRYSILVSGANIISYQVDDILAEDQLSVPSISAGDFGLVGDGTDETVKMQNALNAASGKQLQLGKALAYGISSVNIPNDVTIVSNGSKFSKLVASATPAITGGIRLTTDRLWLVTVGGATDVGINLNGGSVNIGEVRVESTFPDSGTTTSLMNGFRIGPPDGSTYVSRDKIGSIFVSNFSRPIVFQNMSHATIGMIQVSSYKRAVYLHNIQNSVFNGANIFGIAPSSTGEAGDNGLLMDGTSDGATASVYVSNWQVSDAGEHAYRLGGLFPIRGFWGSSLKAIRPGSGGTHGGSGFKALGSDSTSYHYDINLDDFYMEDGNPLGGNYCGIQLGLVDGGQINSPIIRANTNAFSCYDGISTLSCNNVQINNPTVKDPAHLGVRFETATDAGFPNGSTDCYIQGGYIDTAAGSGFPVVQFDGNGSNLNGAILRCGIRGGTLLRRGTMAVNALPVTTGGSYTDCFIDASYYDSQGTGTILTGTTAFLADIRLNNFPANNQTPAANGSTQRSTATVDNRLYVKSAAGWGPPGASFQVVMADQTAISWTPIAATGWYFITANDITHYGQSYARTSPASVAKIAGGTAYSTATTALTGSTGTAGNVTLSTFGGLMYLENRAGNSLTATVHFIG